MKAESVVKVMQGAVVGAAIGTAVLVHQGFAEDAGRQNAPAPVESTLIPCDVRDGLLVCDGSPGR